MINTNHRAVMSQHLLLIWIAFVTLEVFPLLLQEWSCAADHPLQMLGRTSRFPRRGFLAPHGRGEGLWLQGARHQGAGHTLGSAVQQSIPKKACSSGEISLVSFEWIIYSKIPHFTGDSRLFYYFFLFFFFFQTGGQIFPAGFIRLGTKPFL